MSVAGFFGRGRCAQNRAVTLSVRGKFGARHGQLTKFTGQTRTSEPKLERSTIKRNEYSLYMTQQTFGGARTAELRPPKNSAASSRKFRLMFIFAAAGLVDVSRICEQVVLSGLSGGGCGGNTCEFPPEIALPLGEKISPSNRCRRTIDGANKQVDAARRTLCFRTPNGAGSIRL